MKVLWLSHLIPYPPKGGVLQRSHHLIKELTQYHEVDLMAFNQKQLISPLFKSEKEGVKEARSFLSHYCRRLAFFDIACDQNIWKKYKLAIKSLFYEPYSINWLKSQEYEYTLNKWVNENNYDLIHFDTISLVPFYNMVPASIITSLDHHNIESHMLLRRAKRETNFLKRGYYWQEGLRLMSYEKLYCPRFSLNITCSDIDKERLMSIAPQSNVITIPNGVDLKYFRPQGLPIKPNRLIFIGTMNWYPNIEAVLYIAENIWTRLKQRHPDLECDIIGANPPASIRELAARYPDFHIHGFVDDVRPYMEAATVYVCPIQDGGGTKLKILDAMAMEKAVVAHPIACEGIHVRHGHNVLLAENELHFIEHINHLLNAKEKREELGKAARRLIEKYYSYQEIGKQLSNAFQKCV